MKKLILALLVLPVGAMAANTDVGTCGWGSKLFDGNRGLAPKVLAVTTNGTSGNQTFAMTSGTSGCSRDGVVRSNWKTVAYIDQNMNRLAKDMSRGTGENLEALGALIGVENADRAEFNLALQSNFANIFTSSKVSSEEVIANIKEALAANDVLAKYATAV